MEEELVNKKGRLIVRNLVFTLGKKQIQKLFQPFGEIVEINLPVNNTNNQNKGFAFVQFKTWKEAMKAISKLNGTTFKGRVIAVDLSVPKTIYKSLHTENKEGEGIEEVKMDVEEPKIEKSKAKKKKDEQEEETKVKGKGSEERGKANKFDEKTTLFVRNISFDTTEEEFKEYFSTYGDINYAKLCMNSQTNMHKGTGFVQYKNEADAQSMIELSKQAEGFYYQQKTKKRSNVNQCIFI
jgi:nucleolar protein 4